MNSSIICYKYYVLKKMMFQNIEVAKLQLHIFKIPKFPNVNFPNLWSFKIPKFQMSKSLVRAISDSLHTHIHTNVQNMFAKMSRRLFVILQIFL